MNSDTLSDNALMNKVREGDLDKLGLLFERYKKVLFSYFWGMNKDPGLSEDLVQNTFMRVLKYRKGFKGEGEFKYWLFHIARNVNADHYRKNKLGITLDIDKHQDTIYDEHNFEKKMTAKEDLKFLHKAMLMLDPDKREIIVLSKIEEMKYSEIAALMNLTEGTVKVRVFRAMNELKEIVENATRKSYSTGINN